MDEKKFKDYSEAKNFSEPKGLGLDKKCRLCKEPIPRQALYALNILAIEQGYCSWSCLVSGMNSTTIAALIKRERERMARRNEP